MCQLQKQGVSASREVTASSCRGAGQVVAEGEQLGQGGGGGVTAQLQDKLAGRRACRGVERGVSSALQNKRKIEAGDQRVSNLCTPPKKQRVMHPGQR